MPEETFWHCTPRKFQALADIHAGLNNQEEIPYRQEWTEDSGPLGRFKTFRRVDLMQFGFKVN